MNLFRFELRKILLCRRGLVIILALVLQTVICFMPKEYEHSYSTEIYKRYLDEFGGEYSQQTHNALSKRLDEYDRIIASHEETVQRYHNDDITAEEFDKHNDAYNKALAEKPTIEYLIEKCEYLESLDRHTELFYDTDWADLIEHSGFEYLTAICLLIIVIPAFCSEYSSGSHIIMISTPAGRYKTALAKLTVCTGFAFVFAFIMGMLRIVPLLTANNGVQGYPVYNIMGLPFDSNMSILHYLLLDRLLKALLWSVLTVFICLDSVFVKNETIVYFTAFVFAVCPALLSNVIGGAAGYVLCAYSLSTHLSPETGLVLPIIAGSKALIYSALTGMWWKAIQNS